MKAFTCRICSGRLYFENSVCVSCGTALGYSRAEHDIVPVDQAGRHVDAEGLVWHVCRNLNLSGCTWLARLEGGQCEACDLTRTRPNDADLVGLSNYPVAEQAKRHVLAELDALGVPVVGRDSDPDGGLAFDLLSSVDVDVTIGHAEGVITIDLAEGDDSHRERIRAQLDEPYRTMLGHFRHEIGHYYQWHLVDPEPARRQRFLELFGDDSVDYQEAVERHYAQGAPQGWKESFISGYATMHPFEDFAETWAHFLHITDTLDTARAYGLAQIAAPGPDDGFRRIVVQEWVPLAIGLNQINRSMGKDDVYPFVIPPPVLDKLDFVADVVTRVAADRGHLKPGAALPTG